MRRMTKYEKKVRKYLAPYRPSNVVSLKASGPLLSMLDQAPQETSTEPVSVYRMEIQIEYGHSTDWYGIWNSSIYRPDLESLTWKYKQQLRGPIREPEEEGIKFSTGMLCGILEDDEHMGVWLPWLDVWEALYEKGMRLNEYTVPKNKLHVGKTQVCFWPEHATFVQEVDFAEFRRRPYEERKAARAASKQAVAISS